MQTVGLWTRPLAYLERCRARYGKRFTLRLLGQEPFVLISDPDEIKQLFTASPEALRPGAGARILEPVFGPSSLLLLDGEEHLTRRRVLLPAFHGDRMALLQRVVLEIIEREVAGWPRNERVSIRPLLQSLTLKVIFAAVFGPERATELEQLRLRLTAMAELGNRSPLSAVPAERVPRRLGPHARFARLRTEVDELLLAEVSRHRREDGEDGADVLSMLLAARDPEGQPLSDGEIRDELMTMLIVGHETTATQLAWVFERLRRAPSVVERLVSEIDAGGGEQYLRATIQEALRRRPVLPTASPRRVELPTEVGGVLYEPGVQLVAAVYLVHHDPEIYPDPHEFRPERFLGVEPGTYTFIPFGGGRRRCIGSGLAMLEMTTVLRTVLTRETIDAAHPGGENAGRRSFAVGPARGAEVILRSREPATGRFQRPAGSIAGSDARHHNREREPSSP